MQARNGAVLGCLVVAVACQESTSSQNVETDDIVMDAEIVANGDDVVVFTAILREGGRTSNTYVVLEGGDELIARVGGRESTMTSVRAGVYETDFELGQGDADTELGIALIRDSHDDAPDSFGALPEPFEITAELTAEAYSRENDDIVLTWEPHGTDDDMSIEAKRVGCFFLERSAVSGDPGEYVLPAGTLTSTDSGDPATCDAELSLWRSRDGMKDGALSGDSILLLRQVRSVEFVSKQ